MKKIIVFIILVLIIFTISNFAVTKNLNTKLEILEVKNINELSSLKASESYSYLEMIDLLKENDFDEIRLKEFEELYSNISEETKEKNIVKFQLVKMEPKKIDELEDCYIVPRLIVAMTFSGEDPESIIFSYGLDSQVINNSNKIIGKFLGDIETHIVSGNEINVLIYGNVVKNGSRLIFPKNSNEKILNVELSKDENTYISFQRNFYDKELKK